MKMKWTNKYVTVTSEIENHNNMVETLMRWQHAGLVIETEPGEKMPEKIDPPKRVLACKCGNDNLHAFTLMSLADVGIYSLCHYAKDGTISSEHQETDYMPTDIGIELGLARPAIRHDREGQPRETAEWKWLLKCDQCKSREWIWGSDLDKFISF
jgi:hypothetical protein